ncbi:HlyD family efflux transporter periplasmic adaptor subunit [Nocardiopsis flavescens]|uniref:HlyD family secretion protein n=1 Tax=Nocardiopsis flavescens TaxID=758803 RepID=A0A1M6FJY9_9ACTN|nr:HlyD family efflux transporter periplasmic adaptor subunit [Nocardiopsis flavescens]SHI97973.1 HlyD family secretion protein [Nocardiopsis flavescens]
MKKWIIIGAAALLLVVAVGGGGYLLLNRLGGSGDEFVTEGAVDVGGAPHPVELGTVDSVMVLDTTVRAEPGKGVKAQQGGQVVHLWVTEGAEVEEGAPIVNVKITEEPAPDAGGEDAAPAAPVTREVSLYAPVDGKVSGLDDVQVGDVLEPGAVVATVAPDVYRAVSTIPANDLYRFYEEPDDILLEIKNGPPPAPCEFLSLGAAEGGEEPSGTDGGFPMDGGGDTGGGAGGELACRVPSDMQVFEGVQGKLSISTGRAEDVVVVPVTAVRGTTGEGEVIVVAEDGTEEVRPVELGVSDGSFIEVVSGVEVGEQVMDPIPLDSRFDVPGAEDETDDMYLEEEGM